MFLYYVILFICLYCGASLFVVNRRKKANFKKNTKMIIPKGNDLLNHFIQSLIPRFIFVKNIFSHNIYSTVKPRVYQ